MDMAMGSYVMEIMISSLIIKEGKSPRGQEKADRM
jgi:hypothetical protein